MNRPFLRPLAIAAAPAITLASPSAFSQGSARSCPGTSKPA